MSEPSLDISTLHRLYRERTITPVQLVDIVQERIAGDDPHRVWITRLGREQMLVYARALKGRDPGSLPLYGVPFAIKDNIDLAGVPTTAACAEFSYTPARSATVVQRLIDAGAIPVGKTNLDQFATGLNGTRSPFGACRNSFDSEYIAGGSSSGSAVATALGQVSFALGTDTAGSGRVPAAFNNLVGLKPTRGRLSMSGVLPACRTLDCVSIFALTAADAGAVLEVANGFDAQDPYSRVSSSLRRIPGERWRFGVPSPAQLEFFGNREYESAFERALEQFESLGGERVEIDLEPFLEAARLLYEGPWVAERYAAIQNFIEQKPAALHPVTRAIIEKGRTFSAVAGFNAMYRIAALRRAIEPTLEKIDVLVTPTAGTTYRIDEMEADPVRCNSDLGYYTNFMNLLDMAAVAVPAGFTAAGMPFGVTVFADAWSDRALLILAGRLQRAMRLPLGATGHPFPISPLPTQSFEGYALVAVCGAHMTGLPLNHQLTERGGFLVEATRTGPYYRFFALPGGPPERPGLVRVVGGGASIDLEVWALPLSAYGSFVVTIPSPLGIGTIDLIDGRCVQGFLCEAVETHTAQDITDFGGWRTYLQYGA